MRLLTALGIALSLPLSSAHSACAPPFAGAWGSFGSGFGYLTTPLGVAVSSDGIVYVADEGNNRVEKFDHNGQYLGEWPTGLDTSPAGIAIDDASGVVYVVLHAAHKVAKYTTSGALLGTLGTPIAGPSKLTYPIGVALGSGKVYVTSWYDGVIRVFDPNGAVLGGWTGVQYPWGITIDASENIYVTSRELGQVVKLSSGGAIIATWGASGTGDGFFQLPQGLLLDAAGNLQVVDSGNNRIQTLDPNGSFVCKWGSAGTGPGQFSHPADIARDGLGQIYVTDGGNNRVESFGDIPVATEATTWGRLKAVYR